MRRAIKNDVEVILTLIKGFADYDCMLNQPLVTVNNINCIIENPERKVLVFEVDFKVTGFAPFLHNYSIFLCFNIFMQVWTSYRICERKIQR